LKTEEATLIGNAIEDAARKLNQLVAHAVTRGLVVVAKTVDVRFMGPHGVTPFVDVDVRVRLEDLEDAPSAEGEAGPQLEPAPSGINPEDVTKAGPKKV
jgi:hypothetical protein